MQCIAVNLDVPDIDASVAFYRDVLGFGEGLHIPDINGRPHYATVWNGQATIMFHRNDHIPAEQRPFSGTGVTLYIDVGNGDLDIDSYYRRLTGAGVQIVKPLADQYWGARDFTIADNSGYHITFAQQMAELSEEQMQENLRREPMQP